MKTTLRNCIATILISIAFTNTQAQTGNPSASIVNNLKLSVENNSLTMNWVVADVAASNYCEVQASVDGKTFSTIGLVMGADPKQTNNNYSYKQGLKKLKPGHVFYRVLNIGTDGKAYASDVIAVR